MMFHVRVFKSMLSRVVVNVDGNCNWLGQSSALRYTYIYIYTYTYTIYIYYIHPAKSTFEFCSRSGLYEYDVLAVLLENKTDESNL